MFSKNKFQIIFQCFIVCTFHVNFVLGWLARLLPSRIFHSIHPSIVVPVSIRQFAKMKQLLSRQWWFAEIGILIGFSIILAASFFEATTAIIYLLFNYGNKCKYCFKIANNKVLKKR